MPNLNMHQGSKIVNLAVTRESVVGTNEYIQPDQNTKKCMADDIIEQQNEMAAKEDDPSSAAEQNSNRASFKQ